MLTKEALVQFAGETSPMLMQKTAAVLAQVERESPEHVSWVARDIDEVAQYTFDKIAAMGAAAKWGLAVGSGIAAGIANDLAGDLYASAKRGFTKTRNFKNIMAANPELKAIDKHRLEQSFDAIHRYAPEMTADPLVGGALLKSVADVSGNEAVAIRSIIDTRKNVVNPFRPGETVQFDKPEKKGPTLGEQKLEAKMRGRSEALKVLTGDVSKSKMSPVQKQRIMRVATKAYDADIDSLK
jgi:hypothetical protein